MELDLRIFMPKGMLEINGLSGGNCDGLVKFVLPACPVQHMTRRILFFSYWYPNAIKANQAIFARHHAHALATIATVEVLAVHILPGKTIYHERYEKEQDASGLVTHRLYIESRFWKWFYVALPWQYLKLKGILRQHIKPNFDFDTIHSNVLYPCGIVGNWLSRYFGCVHVITEHWSKLPKFFSRSVYRWSGKKAYQEAHAVTAVSQQLLDVMQGYRHNAHAAVVPNVIDSSRFFPEPEKPKHSILTFTAVAHWQAPKNPFYYLEALAKLHAKAALPEFQVILVGEGSILNQVRKRSYPFPIQTPGNLEPEHLRRHLNACHVFLHGSDFETFSVVIVEALMCGIPCVVSPVGIAPQVIKSGNGYIAQNTVADWQDKIVRVANEKFKAESIAGSVGNQYSLTEVGMRFLEVYRAAKLVHD